MKVAGIILLVLQVISIIGGILNGSLPEMIGNAEIVKIIGFIIPGIIGAVLLTVRINKKSSK